MLQHYRDNIHLLTYGYDIAGRTNSLLGTLAGVTKVNLAYQWDNANRLTRITDTAGNHRVDFAYTLTGDYLTLTRYADTNGTQLVATSSYAYDNADRLTSLIHALGTGGGTSLSYALAYDANNQITSITSGDGVNNFTNDNNGQETSASLTSENYSYDSTGNRTSGGTVTGADNRVSEDATYTYSYNNEGNLTLRTRKDGSGSDTFAWDYRNRLTSVTTRNGSGTVTLTATYAYDAFDRRIRRTLSGSTNLDEQYLYDGTGDADVLLVTDGTGTVTLRQLNGPGSNQVLAEDRISGTTSSTVTTRWALSDHEGTVRDVVDHAGAVVDHIVYGSYGNITSQSNAIEQMRATYTGAPTDSETGFVYLYHRYLNPTTGRWMSQDPLSFGAGDVNLYRYVGNGPMNGTDSSGLAENGKAQSYRDPLPIPTVGELWDAYVTYGGNVARPATQLTEYSGLTQEQRDVSNREFGNQALGSGTKQGVLNATQGFANDMISSVACGLIPYRFHFADDSARQACDDPTVTAISQGFGGFGLGILIPTALETPLAAAAKYLRLAEAEEAANNAAIRLLNKIREAMGLGKTEDAATQEARDALNKLADNKDYPIKEAAKNALNRPYIRKKVRAEVEARAPKTVDGKFIDPNTGEVIEGKHDLGHTPGHEFRTEKANAEAEGLSQKQFNDRMNDPDLYQVESPSSNRSHRYEKKE